MAERALDCVPRAPLSRACGGIIAVVTLVKPERRDVGGADVASLDGEGDRGGGAEHDPRLGKGAAVLEVLAWIEALGEHVDAPPTRELEHLSPREPETRA